MSDYRSMHCMNCGENFVTSEQMRHNDRRINEAKARFDHLLTGSDIQALRESWGMSQAVASDIFGGGPNSFYKYERSEVLVSKSMDLLLRSFSKFPEVRAWLCQHAGHHVIRHRRGTDQGGWYVLASSGNQLFMSEKPTKLYELESGNDWHYFDNSKKVAGLNG